MLQFVSYHVLRKLMSLPCLHQAVSTGRLHQIRLLLDIGVKPTLVDNQGRTPLMTAACMTKETIALRISRLLLSRGAPTECVDSQGRTALSYACENGHCKLVKLLIDDDYDINMPDKEGNTPLMYAAISGNVATLREILCVVLKYRLSVDLRNKKGFSAYLLAAKMAHSECARILKTEGNASDCVRDTEYFLSDKEWAKRMKRNLNRDKNSKTVQKIDSRTRPNTSFELRRTNKLAEGSRNPRAISRLTTRSEPGVMVRRSGLVNTWLPCSEEHWENEQTLRGTSPSSVSSSSRQSTVPRVVRTLTPDLHAIFSQYVLIDNRPAVTVADRRMPYAHKHEESRVPSKPASRNSRMSVSTKKKVSILR